MERLTKRLPGGAANYNYPKSCYIGDRSGADRISKSAFRQRCVERLAEYEDTGLEPAMCANYKTFENEAISKGVTFKRIVALMEADRAGRLVVLPCKVGDTVWAILGGKKYACKCIVEYVNIGGRGLGTTIVLCEAEGLREQYGVTVAAFGKTVFLTREEAKRALEAMKDGN
mgnify:FL=1